MTPRAAVGKLPGLATADTGKPTASHTTRFEVKP